MTKILTTLTLSLTIAGASNAASFHATDSSVTTDVCMAAVQGNKMKFRKTVKENRLRMDYVANKVQCNDQHIMNFVAQYGKNPEKINTLLSKYRKPQHVEITDLAKL